MTSMIWTLDDEGHLTVAWITPPAAKTVAPPARLLRAVSRRIQTLSPDSFTRRRAA